MMRLRRRRGQPSGKFRIASRLSHGVSRGRRVAGHGSPGLGPVVLAGAILVGSAAGAAGTADTTGGSLLEDAPGVFRTAVSQAGAEDSFEQLRALLRHRLADVEARGISAAVRAMLDAPLEAANHANGLAASVDVNGQPATLLGSQLDRFAKALSLQQGTCQADSSLTLSDSAQDAGLPRLQSGFARAAAAATEAFAAVPAAQGERFLERLAALLADTAGGAGDGDDEASAAFAADLSRVVEKVDFGSLDCSMRHLASMTDQAGLRALSAWAEKAQAIMRPDWLDPRILGDFLWAERTEHGIFLVGADGTNIYGAPVAAIVDVGGDDMYLGSEGLGYGPATGSLEGAVKARIIVDLAGDDLYVAPGDVSAGGAVMGTALLYDAVGDDVYAASRIGQGAGVIGHGALVDLAGDDRYVIDAIGQGAALAGTGVAFDGAGRDLWSAAVFAQGSGGPLGRGVLVERSGDDVFRIGGRYPSSWGTPGIFQALGQGSGWGIQPKLAGGVGLLDDRGGDDVYLGGNFSQGAGYYLGVGVLLDAAGDDRYRGSRYTQGSAAHLAAGVLVDWQGSDSYTGAVAANQGSGWDLALGALLDGDGNDDYQGADLSQGSAAQNGVGLLLDTGGADRFAASGNNQGFSGALAYGEGRGATNLAVFVRQAVVEKGTGETLSVWRSVINGRIVSVALEPAGRRNLSTSRHR